MLAGCNRYPALSYSQKKAESAEDSGQNSQGTKPEVLGKDDTERCSQSQPSISGNSIERDDFSGVLWPRAGDSPQRRSRRTKAFAHTQRETTRNERSNSEPWSQVESPRRQ